MSAGQHQLGEIVIARQQGVVEQGVDGKAARGSIEIRAGVHRSRAIIVAGQAADTGRFKIAEPAGNRDPEWWNRVIAVASRLRGHIARPQSAIATASALAAENGATKTTNRRRAIEPFGVNDAGNYYGPGALPIHGACALDPDHGTRVNADFRIESLRDVRNHICLAWAQMKFIQSND